MEMNTGINLMTNHELICIDINSNIKIRLVEDLYQTMGNLIENEISIIMGDLNSPTIINWESLSSK